MTLKVKKKVRERNARLSLLVCVNAPSTLRQRCVTACLRRSYDDNVRCIEFN